MKTCICAIAKWEELYIREWIDHHKNIGVDHIIIADNNESNYENPLQPIIQDYVDNGYVTILDYNNMKSIEYSVQLRYYNDAYKKYYMEYDWIFFIDIDEFIELPAYNNDIKLFLSNEKFKDKNAIMFYWQDYYNNNSLYYEDKPLKERFPLKYKAKKNKISVKTIYSTKLLKNNEKFNLLSIHLSLKDIDLNNVCDVKGNNNFLLHDSHNINELKENKYVKLTNINIEDNDCFNYAYIRHHRIKSCEEYIKYKCIKGRFDVPLKNFSINKIRYSLTQYISYLNINKIKYNINDITKMFEKYEKEINNTIEHKLSYNKK